MEKFLHETTVSAIPSPEKVVLLTSNMSVGEAIRILTTHNILCAPLVRNGAKPEEPWEERYLGLVDMAGMVFHLLEHVNKGHQGVLIEDLEKIDGFSRLPVTHVSDFSRWIPFQPLRPNSTIADACRLLSEEGMHRAPVIDEKGELVNIITQSNLLSFLCANLGVLKPVVSKTLEEIGLAEASHVITLPASATTLEGFELLKKHRISAVPVVDEDGQVVGNLSVRHVREMLTKKFMSKMLLEPVTEFLAATVDKSRDEMHPAITCAKNTTLERVIRKLDTSRIHRIYVKNDDGIPIRVVSLRDILAHITAN